MRYIWHHIREIIEQYRGEVPLAHFLKNYFKGHPKLGSRDRKILTAMAYSWYRCAKSLADMPTRQPHQFDEKVKACLVLCGNEDILTLLKDTTSPAIDSLKHDVQSLLPFHEPLSDGISRNEWLASMLSQPRLFIRVRNKNNEILRILGDNGIAAVPISGTCFSLPNGAKIDQLLPPASYVVQDASSQQTAAFFSPGKNEEWYDCCSGAGGKSIQLRDIEPSVKLTVSDKRKSILHNLVERFRLYNLPLPSTYVVDVANKTELDTILGNTQFDNIICDVPCSGSGTWARTPEQLYFFNPSCLDQFSPLQETIAVNAAAHLKKAGRLIYITCSIFRKENEVVIERITQKTGLSLVSSKLINGINIHADSMFVAVLEKQH